MYICNRTNSTQPEMLVLFVSLQGKTVTLVKGVRVCGHHCRDYGL
jgi:hypothetical protein